MEESHYNPTYRILCEVLRELEKFEYVGGAFADHLFGKLQYLIYFHTNKNLIIFDVVIPQGDTFLTIDDIKCLTATDMMKVFSKKLNISTGESIAICL